MDFDIKYDIIPLDDVYLFTTPLPTNAEVLLHQVPVVPNQRHEIKSVDIVCLKTLVIDGSDALVGFITAYDYSAGADVSAKLLTGAAGAAGDLKTAVLDLKVVYPLFKGNYSLDAGDNIRAVLTTTAPETAGVGYFFIVGYKVMDYNGE